MPTQPTNNHSSSDDQSPTHRRSISPFVRDIVAAKYGKAGQSNSRAGSPILPSDGSDVGVGSNPLLAPILAPTLIYLRVSSKDQLNTALDIDRNGLSIATQEAECRNKVDAVGGELVHPPFIEPGNSGKDVEHRPVFKDMLAYIKQHPGIKYVVTYNRARAFRNHFDAAIHVAQLSKLGIRVITVKDDFGEGPQAVAMEGMLDVMNGLMNTMNGLDIQTKMAYKATHGGTIGRASLGYLNTKTKIDGKDVSTVIIDEKRAPLVVKAFELYATGEYTLGRLEATMADLGLTVRPSSKNPNEHPASDSKLQDMLKDPYYLGYIVYNGELYPGNHEPLVDEALFQRVQEVMDMRSRPGQRDRVHQHYLKGMLFCQRCHKEGRTSRLIFTQPTGRSGKKYSYFVCRGKQDGVCDLPHLRVEDVEYAITEHYQTLTLPDTFITDVTATLDDTLNTEQASSKELHASLSRQLKKLEQQENRLVDALADGSLPGDKIRAKLRDIKLQKNRISSQLLTTTDELKAGAVVLKDALTLLRDPYQLYKDSATANRRQLNQAFYERFYVDERQEPTIDTTVPDDQKTPIFEELHQAKAVHQHHRANRTTDTTSRDSTSSAPSGIGTATRRAGHMRPGGAQDTQDAYDGSNEAFRGEPGAINDESLHGVEADRQNVPMSSVLPAEPCLADVFSVNDSSKAVMVVLAGFEPATPRV